MESMQDPVGHKLSKLNWYRSMYSILGARFRPPWTIEMVKLESQGLPSAKPLSPGYFGQKVQPM